MRQFDQAGSLGALLLGSALLGYAIYEVVRTVTIALFDAAVSAAGFFGLLFNLGGLLTRRLPQMVYVPGLAFGALFLVNSALSYELTLIAAVLAMVWSFWLAAVLWREARSTESLAPVRA